VKIELTPNGDSVFTADELFAVAVETGGPEIHLERVDFDIVLRGVDFIESVGSGKMRLL
jgi:hypothetical protein